MPRAELRSKIGMVLQDTWLFGGTIRDNIAYGNPDATEEQILEAARATYVDRFVHSLPDGYDTLINEEADNVSAGQKQLLTIARAFLADPSILILDEATSSVDTRTEVLIQEAMNRAALSRTSFVIAHRLSTIRGADVILVMEHGAHRRAGLARRAARRGRRLRPPLQLPVRRPRHRAHIGPGATRVSTTSHLRHRDWERTRGRSRRSPSGGRRGDNGTDKRDLVGGPPWPAILRCHYEPA